jgi:dipeptidyl aminopeptidase/acylaminoacyl peptidase
MPTKAPRTDGTIVEQTRCEPERPISYAAYVRGCNERREKELADAKREGITATASKARAPVLSEREFERRQAYRGFECLRIRYLSDGLQVVGFIWKPKRTAGLRLPLILFNRGGNRELGKLTPWYRFGFHYFLSQGFVVIASQYRGNDGGEGQEEFGGADVSDVLNLLTLARRLGYVDMKNVFLLGESRGGFMAWLALKHGLPANAAAVIGASADLVAFARQRPEVVDIALRRLIPDYDEERLRERSALYWPDKLNAPLLIMQGGADWRVDIASQTLPLVQKLQELRKTYELVIYAEDDHALSLNREDSDRRTVEWFRRFAK